MKTRLLYLLSISATLILTGCPDPECYNPYPLYSFNVNARFTPEQDSIQIGDTIFLVSEFSSAVTTNGSQTQVSYVGTRTVGANISIAQLPPLTDMPVGAISSFDYKVITGTMFSDKSNYKPEMDRRLRYEEVGDDYKLKIAFIPKVKGVFAVGFNGGFVEGKAASKRCEGTSFEIVVSNPDVHLNYFKSWLKAPVTPIPTNGYWFKVY